MWLIGKFFQVEVRPRPDGRRWAKPGEPSENQGSPQEAEVAMRIYIQKQGLLFIECPAFLNLFYFTFPNRGVVSYSPRL
ncbi:hypothetical protein DW993_00180 [Clostridium sp. AM51-4]|nr:hypothetical protein DW993_00180 [Clostridium sp. AM51-4]